MGISFYQDMLIGIEKGVSTPKRQHGEQTMSIVTPDASLTADPTELGRDLDLAGPAGWDGDALEADVALAVEAHGVHGCHVGGIAEELRLALDGDLGKEHSGRGRYMLC